MFSKKILLALFAINLFSICTFQAFGANWKARRPKGKIFQSKNERKQINRANTLLLNSASNGNLTQFKEALDKRAQIRVKDYTGMNALLLASKEGYWPIIEYWLEKGLKTNHVCENGNNALHYAASNGHIALAKKLMKSEKLLNGKNNKEQTPSDRVLNLIHFIEQTDPVFKTEEDEKLLINLNIIYRLLNNKETTSYQVKSGYLKRLPYLLGIQESNKPSLQNKSRSFKPRSFKPRSFKSRSFKLRPVRTKKLPPQRP